MIEAFNEFVSTRACLNSPKNYPKDKQLMLDIIEFENNAYKQGFSDALHLLSLLPPA